LVGTHQPTNSAGQLQQHAYEHASGIARSRFQLCSLAQPASKRMFPLTLMILIENMLDGPTSSLALRPNSSSVNIADESPAAA